MSERDLASAVVAEVKKVIVGKDAVLVKVLAAILAGGHILLEDIPGVGKTTMALAFAKALGLRVIVAGNGRAKEQFLAMGVDRYLDYKAENYWEVLSDIDHVIDTLGPTEFEHELAVLKKGGRLVSLRTGPNKAFAQRNHFTGLKKLLFALAGSKFDKAAQKQGKEYRFVFVRSNGAQLQKITEILEKQQVKPAVDSRVFSLDQANAALQLVAKGQLNGKVMIQM